MIEQICYKLIRFSIFKELSVIVIYGKLILHRICVNAFRVFQIKPIIARNAILLIKIAHLAVIIALHTLHTFFRLRYYYSSLQNYIDVPRRTCLTVRPVIASKALSGTWQTFGIVEKIETIKAGIASLTRTCATALWALIAF